MNSWCNKKVFSELSHFHTALEGFFCMKWDKLMSEAELLF